MPDFAFFKASRAPWVFPLFAGPVWKMIRRFISLAETYQLWGDFMLAIEEEEEEEDVLKGTGNVLRMLRRPISLDKWVNIIIGIRLWLLRPPIL